MSTLLVTNADVLVTMDAHRREIPGGGLFVRDGWIEAVGASGELPSTADEVVDMTGRVVMPGLVNTHHHFYQTLTRAMAPDSELFPWLQQLYPVWARVTPDHVRVSTQMALAELALSGCTTAFDHHYLWPAGTSVDQQVEAARQIGLRFHAARGSMSLGESEGGLPPDSVVEDEDAILEDSRRVVEEFHDPSPGAMTRIVLAPCSPFSVTTGLMRDSAILARDLGVRLHTHLAETADEDAFCLETFGLRPVDYAATVGWLDGDVWFAHGVYLSQSDIGRMSRSGTGVAHCPTSNMRLSSGIAPLAELVAAGVPVGLGVDGSASNDTSHLLAEARQALLLDRVARAQTGGDRPMPTARRALEIATRGGAEVLGRTDIGSLEPGKVCDLAAFRTDVPALAGAHDLVAALVLCGPLDADRVVVHGRTVVEEGRMVTVELESLIERHRGLAVSLLD